MKTQNKIILIISIALLFFLIVFIFFQQNQAKQYKIFLNANKKQQKEIADAILKLKSDQLEKTILEFSINDELCSIIENNDIAKLNLLYEKVFQFNINALWVYSMEHEQIFFYETLYKNGIIRKNIPIAEKVFKELFSTHNISFFMSNDKGLLEIKGATIHSDKDIDRKQIPYGYIFIGKLWDEDYLKDLETYTGNIVYLRIANAPETRSFDKSVTTYNISLNNYLDEPIVNLVFAKRNPPIKYLNSLLSYSYLYLASLAIVIIFLFLITFQIFVKRPLKIISKSLENQDTQDLHKVKKMQNEFSEIGILTEKFVDHKKLLQQEIEEHKKTYNALKESEDKYKAIVENTHDAIFIYHNYKVIYTNKAVYNLLGYNIRDCKTLNLWDVLHPHDKEKVIAYGRAKITGDELIPNIQIRVFTKQKLIKSFELALQTVSINNENAVLGVVHDINELKHSENKLKISDEILQKINALIVVSDVKGDITFVSPSVKSILGFEPNELLGDGWWQKCRVNSAEKIYEKNVYAKMAKGDLAVNENPFELLLTDVKGEYKWFQWQESYSKNGFVICIGQNINVLKQSENFRKNLKMAEKMAKIKQEFMVNLSEQMHKPIRSIINNINNIEKNDISPSNELLEIKKHTNNLLSIVDDIHLFSIIEAGKMNILPEIFNLNNTINNCCNLFKPQINQKGLQLFVNISSEIPEKAKADENHIKQILNNLISNAVKYTNNGDITVKAKIAEKNLGKFKIKIEVIDTGIGIDREDLNKLFTDTQHFNITKKENPENSGLGLYISKKFVQLMEGEIGAESKPNIGSNFWFTFDVEIISDTK